MNLSRYIIISLILFLILVNGKHVYYSFPLSEDISGKNLPSTTTWKPNIELGQLNQVSSRKINSTSSNIPKPNKFRRPSIFSSTGCSRCYSAGNDGACRFNIAMCRRLINK